ncbi:hypothetical protein ASG22_19735 [Chryseobacterium sp. Leaf405]|uniref:hypothetical protein n=1 Tax=Chryseobacterium sp. Leaf405 TaxID=1736367 RepID=UPI0006FA37F7|nr:hypothetical protein [Chryseobacterium sp. Leaf405]KQT29558.1 hypothetical protein ASG22_19735 [Chryseobacterium sp. Leaf405]
MRTKILLVITLINYNTLLLAQSYKALNKVHMTEGFILKKKTIVQNCSQSVAKGSNIKSTLNYKRTSKENEELISVTTEKIADSASIIFVDKIITEDIKSFTGDANIFVDQADNSLIHINYWLNDIITLPTGTKIKTITQKLLCDRTYSKESSKTQELNINTNYNLWQITNEEMMSDPDYLKHSNVVIEVYEKDGKTIKSYLVNKYDKDADYTVQIDNRTVLHFKETGVEFGPVTIPIKIRPGFKRNGISVDQEFSSDFNLGAFAGVKIGKYRARYVRGEGFTQLPTSSSATIGGFLSFSTSALDKTSTTASENPIVGDNKKTIGVVSPGIGIMYSIYNFQLGFFGGCDFGLGSDAKNWNYNSKIWMGFGFGYNLSNFWKK